MAAAKKPRRRDAARTKADILLAAQQAFAEQGYPQTGIRDIAQRAGVSSTLLLRYYGSKAALFEAALIEALQIGGVIDGGREQFGLRLAAVFLDHSIEIRPPSILALSISDPEARALATGVIETWVIEPLSAWLGAPSARVRALEIMMLTMGYVLFSRHLPLIAGRPKQEKEAAQWLATTLQQIVDRP